MFVLGTCLSCAQKQLGRPDEVKLDCDNCGAGRLIEPLRRENVREGIADAPAA